MSGNNILDEYLVKLGFSIDTVGASRFAGALRDAASLVDRQYGGMVKKVAEFHTAAVGAFAAVGAAALGIADKTAQADQEYRLLALHMYTSLPVARELKIALDALGQPLENIMWDPELARRFNQLVKDQRALTEELGPNFENQMMKIRDVRFEFSRFGVELQYLTMKVVEDLAEAFGTTMSAALDKFREFNNWFIQNMPAIAAWITDKLKPVLMDVYEVMKSTWETIKVVGVAFREITGDASIIDFFAKLAITINNVVQMAAHLAGGLGLLAHGNFKAANIEFKAAAALAGPGTGTAGAAITGALVGTAIGGPAGALTGIAIGALGGLIAGSGSGASDKENIKAAIAHNAPLFNVPPELALAVAQVESGFRQINSTAPGSHATGIFQLQPGTAREVGVDANDPSQNIVGGLKYLSKLLGRYGSQELALEHYYGSKNPAENQAYAQRVMRVESGVKIDHLTIVVPSANMSKESITDAVKRGMEDSNKNQTQRNINEFSSPGWSY